MESKPNRRCRGRWRSCRYRPGRCGRAPAPDRTARRRAARRRSGGPARSTACRSGSVTSPLGSSRDLGGFLAHGAADFHIGRNDADAAHQPLLLRRLARLGNSFQSAISIARFICAGEVAGIVDLPGRGLVRHRLRRDQILAPDRIRRHARACARRQSTSRSTT